MGAPDTALRLPGINRDECFTTERLLFVCLEVIQCLLSNVDGRVAHGWIHRMGIAETNETGDLARGVADKLELFRFAALFADPLERVTASGLQKQQVARRVGTGQDEKSQPAGPGRSITDSEFQGCSE